MIVSLITTPVYPSSSIICTSVPSMTLQWPISPSRLGSWGPKPVESLQTLLEQTIVRGISFFFLFLFPFLGTCALKRISSPEAGSCHYQPRSKSMQCRYGIAWQCRYQDAGSRPQLTAGTGAAGAGARDQYCFNLSTVIKT